MDKLKIESYCTLNVPTLALRPRAIKDVIYTCIQTVTCIYPLTQLLHHTIIVVSGSQDSPPIEGQFITYTCPTGFILTGPNASVCAGNREWEPDPG